VNGFWKGFSDVCIAELERKFKPAVIAGLEALRQHSREISYEMDGNQMYDVYMKARKEFLSK